MGHATITNEFAFVDFASDAGARMVLGKSEYPLCDMFRGNEGPNMFKLSAKGQDLQELAKLAEAEWADKNKKRLALEDTLTPVVLNTREKRVREESLVLARAQIPNQEKKLRMLRDYKGS